MHNWGILHPSLSVEMSIIVSQVKGSCFEKVLALYKILQIPKFPLMYLIGANALPLFASIKAKDDQSLTLPAFVLPAKVLFQWLNKAQPQQAAVY